MVTCTCERDVTDQIHIFVIENISKNIFENPEYLRFRYQLLVHTSKKWTVF